MPVIQYATSSGRFLVNKTSAEWTAVMFETSNHHSGHPHGPQRPVRPAGFVFGPKFTH